ncbi:MAG: hypothetical protein RL367_500, partial [Pseudomonadota bacterium]
MSAVALLNVDRVVAAAEQATGLHDWAGDAFREGLERLFESIMTESGIDPVHYPRIEAGQAFVL